MAEAPKPHIAILPSPGMGHLIPVAELAKKLHLRHHFSVTFIIPSDAATSHLRAQKSFLLQSLPNSINCLFLPPVSLSHLPPETRLESRISLTVNRSLPDLRRALSTLRASALVVDILGVFALDVARELGIPSYIFFFSNAMALSLVLHLSELDKAVAGEYRDMVDHVRLPGCVPLNGRDLPDHFQDRTDEAYRFALEKCRKYAMADGIIINCFWHMEPEAFEALRNNGRRRNVPVYPVGPFIQTSSTSMPNSSAAVECLKWLDKQPEKSVLYVAFGSGGTIRREQLIELAHGLEMSRNRFVWVVKTPDENASNAAFFDVVSAADDPPSSLPEGFLERTRERGIVVASWAPQARILSHSATGGFLTHCGWNSCLDGVVNGVPMIAWPLFAEQRMSAALLSEGLKVAVRVEADERGIVGRNEVAKRVNELISSEEIGKKMEVLKKAAADARSETGSSEKALSELAARLIHG